MSDHSPSRMPGHASNTTTYEVRRIVDIPSLALLLIGLTFGFASVISVLVSGYTPLVCAPSLLAMYLGARNLTARIVRPAPNDGHH